MIWSDFEFVIHLACIIKPRILDIIIDNNDNDMNFFGNIVCLRPCSVICGPRTSRSGRKWHYAGANKQYSLKKSCYSLILQVI